MVDSTNPMSQSRFFLGTPGSELPKRRKTFEESHSWFENNLPGILQAATQLAFMPLDIVAPGAGTAAGAVAGQGVGLGTRALQGREVGKEQLAQAGVGAGLGAVQGAVKGGVDAYNQQSQIDMQQQKTPDVSMGSDLSRRAGVTPEFYMRDSLTMPGGEVINNPSFDQLQEAADLRMANVYFGDRIGQGANLAEQQGIADNLFSGENPAFGIQPRTQKNLEAMYPGLKINPGVRGQATRLGESAFNPPAQPLPTPTPSMAAPQGQMQTPPPQPQYNTNLDYEPFGQFGRQGMPFGYGVNPLRRFR